MSVAVQRGATRGAAVYGGLRGCWSWGSHEWSRIVWRGGDVVAVQTGAAVWGGTRGCWERGDGGWPREVSCGLVGSAVAVEGVPGNIGDHHCHL